jgi:hypothetical protein
MEPQKNFTVVIPKPDVEKLKNIIVQKSDSLYKQSQENLQKAKVGIQKKNMQIVIYVYALEMPKEKLNF